MIRLAVIGAGRWGTILLTTLKNLPGCRVVAVCDPATRSGASGVQFEDLVVRDDLDGVVVATPGSTHAQVALPFLWRGVPVFIEKPMTTLLRDAQRLQRAARKAGTFVFVGHVHLYNPAYLKAQSLVRRSGKLRWLFFEGMNNGPFRDDMSALWDWGPHDVSMAVDLLGGVPTSVQAWGVGVLRPRTDLHDTVFVRMVFPGNIVALMTLSWLFPEKRKRMTVVGERDTVVYDDVVSSSPSSGSSVSGKVLLYRGMGPKVHHGSVAQHQGEPARPSYSASLPLTRELKAFVHSVRTGKQPLTNVDNGVAVVRVLAAAEKSLRSGGKRVRV